MEHCIKPEGRARGNEGQHHLSSNINVWPLCLQCDLALSHFFGGSYEYETSLKGNRLDGFFSFTLEDKKRKVITDD